MNYNILPLGFKRLRIECDLRNTEIQDGDISMAVVGGNGGVCGVGRRATTRFRLRTGSSPDIQRLVYRVSRGNGRLMCNT